MLVIISSIQGPRPFSPTSRWSALSANTCGRSAGVNCSIGSPTTRSWISYAAPPTAPVAIVGGRGIAAGAQCIEERGRRPEVEHVTPVELEHGAGAVGGANNVERSAALTVRHRADEYHAGRGRDLARVSLEKRVITGQTGARTPTVAAMSERSRHLPRRSCLSVPGSSEKMLGKAPGLGADMVFLDLEDAVAAAREAGSARQGRERDQHARLR